MAVLSLTGATVRLQQTVSEENRLATSALAYTALTALAPCHITSNGVVMSGGNGVDSTDDAGNVCLGFTTRAYAAGDAVTLYSGIVVNIDNLASDLTVGAKYFIDVSTSTKGRLADSAPTGFTTQPIAIAISASQLLLLRHIPINQVVS